MAQCGPGVRSPSARPERALIVAPAPLVPCTTKETGLADMPALFDAILCMVQCAEEDPERSEDIGVLQEGGVAGCLWLIALHWHMPCSASPGRAEVCLAETVVGVQWGGCCGAGDGGSGRNGGWVRFGEERSDVWGGVGRGGGARCGGVK